MAAPRPETDLQSLTRHLEGMIRQFKELTNLLLQERDAIKKRKINELETVTRLIELAQEGVRSSDQQRQELTGRLCRSTGLAAEGATLADLDEKLGGKTGLTVLREQLKKVILQADKVNQENRAILQGVQQATEALLAIFRKSAQGGDSYNRLGGKRAGSALNLYSRKL